MNAKMVTTSLSMIPKRKMNSRKCLDLFKENMKRTQCWVCIMVSIMFKSSCMGKELEGYMSEIREYLQLMILQVVLISFSSCILNISIMWKWYILPFGRKEEVWEERWKEKNDVGRGRGREWPKKRNITPLDLSYVDLFKKLVSLASVYLDPRNSVQKIWVRSFLPSSSPAFPHKHAQKRLDLRFTKWLLHTLPNIGQEILMDFPLTTWSGSVRTEMCSRKVCLGFFSPENAKGLIWPHSPVDFPPYKMLSFAKHWPKLTVQSRTETEGSKLYSDQT